jgi:hypothetical protein
MRLFVAGGDDLFSRMYVGGGTLKERVRERNRGFGGDP